MAAEGKKTPAKSSKPRTKRRTTKELTREHTHQEDHKITDEDFKNVVIGADIPDESKEPLELPENKDRPHDEDKDGKMVTPWDVIK